MSLIRDAQIEGMRPENLKRERIKGENTRFVADGRGLLTRYSRVWVPISGGIGQMVMEEAHKSHFSIHPGENCINIVYLQTYKARATRLSLHPPDHIRELKN